MLNDATASHNLQHTSLMLLPNTPLACITSQANTTNSNALPLLSPIITSNNYSKYLTAIFATIEQMKKLCCYLQRCCRPHHTNKSITAQNSHPFLHATNTLLPSNPLLPLPSTPSHLHRQLELLVAKAIGQPMTIKTPITPYSQHNTTTQSMPSTFPTPWQQAVSLLPIPAQPPVPPRHYCHRLPKQTTGHNLTTCPTPSTMRSGMWQPLNIPEFPTMPHILLLASTTYFGTNSSF